MTPMIALTTPTEDDRRIHAVVEHEGHATGGQQEVEPEAAVRCGRGEARVWGQREY